MQTRLTERDKKGAKNRVGKFGTGRRIFASYSWLSLGFSTAVTLLSLLFVSVTFSLLPWDGHSVNRGYPFPFVMYNYPPLFPVGNSSTPYYSFSAAAYFSDIIAWFIVSELILFGLLNRPIRQSAYLIAGAILLTLLSLLWSDSSLLSHFQGQQVGSVYYGFPLPFLTVFYGFQQGHSFDLIAMSWDMVFWFGIFIVIYSVIIYTSGKRIKVTKPGSY
ncbi:MAG: hypothetical protein PXX82_04085 [Methanomassiliicoccales archaeon]|nr:hypothetical protein [Methanomassiliicoccales archaeon]